jgi:Tol biopolymer transport system component
MADLQTLVHSEMDRAGSPSYSFEDLSRRRARRQQNRRIGAAVLAIIVAVVSFAALISTFRTVERPATEPTPASPRGIFADVGGWIAYGNEPSGERIYGRGRYGLWAVDSTRPNDPKARIQLSDRLVTPLAWSSDGSKLLIWRERHAAARVRAGVLFVLNADGTETRLVTNPTDVGYIAPAGSFSPNGSQVVFATFDAIYTVDAELPANFAGGGTPRLVLAATREIRRDLFTGQERRLRTSLFHPAFSPDGTQIAYVDGMGDWGNTLRVMNADGTGVRVLVGSRAVDSSGCFQMAHPSWSPDGTHIAFSCAGAIWVVDADGSGLTEVIPSEETGAWYGSPAWSPDGSRIAFEVHVSGRGWLEIADADGTHVQTFGHGAHAGPWNPLPLSVPGESNPGAGLATPLVYAIALAMLLGVLVGGRRARHKKAAKR